MTKWRLFLFLLIRLVVSSLVWNKPTPTAVSISHLQGLSIWIYNSNSISVLTKSLKIALVINITVFLHYKHDIWVFPYLLSLLLSLLLNLVAYSSLTFKILLDTMLITRNFTCQKIWSQLPNVVVGSDWKEKHIEIILKIIPITCYADLKRFSSSGKSFPSQLI